MAATKKKSETVRLTFEEFRQEILKDLRLAIESREASLIGRREVLTGKAKFGIFGDGKELAQIALAKFVRDGDFRAGYYRDQTLMMALGLMTTEQFFAQLYAHPSLAHEPMSVGRQMNGHFATRWVDEHGRWLPLTTQPNSSADISPTAGQMPRLLGLGLASVFFRNNPQLAEYTQFSFGGDEIAIGTIGDASTSEGHFWETLNAAAVTGAPILLSVWDDGYGISVPREYQTALGSISRAAEGFALREGEQRGGIRIFKARAWNYPELIRTYEKASEICRSQHVPCLVHVIECTQPQGHSTSGSHERYKSKERLAWEQEYDNILQFKKWIVAHSVATEEEVEQVDKEAREAARKAKNVAWENFISEIQAEKDELLEILSRFPQFSAITEPLRKEPVPGRQLVLSTARKARLAARYLPGEATAPLKDWIRKFQASARDKYNSFLYNEHPTSALQIKTQPPQYAPDAPLVDGRVVLRDNWDVWLSREPRLMIFGEDVGHIGGVNQTLEGMQAKYGPLRVFDTGIREQTIVGQGIGMAMRGLRPVAEIQYLDYLLYALQTLSDDLATLTYRTKGGQQAPLIVSTRGHRLEGIWHSGSPMGMIVHALRGIHVCVPRNMTQAAAMYNTLMRGMDPALVIEPLNGYRLKERLPSNLGDFTVELGVPEVVRAGTDVTLVTYGSCCRIALAAAQDLAELGIEVEVVDVQTLLPFDRYHIIRTSLEKTNRLVILDEDVRGGASAYMLQKILEDQGGFELLETAPVTITAQDHRPAYGSDGDYFSKPSEDDVVEAVYALMHPLNPRDFPNIF
ncbi:MAG: thiamine pyrophosphate-dependent enzyme [Flavobacteriales bacterium]|nr:thiamine pyrophosphate-dependent enzyme [Flavobacteriales bacterium]